MSKSHRQIKDNEPREVRALDCDGLIALACRDDALLDMLEVIEQTARAEGRDAFVLLPVTGAIKGNRDDA